MSVRGRVLWLSVASVLASFGCATLALAWSAGPADGHSAHAAAAVPVATPAVEFVVFRDSRDNAPPPSDRPSAGRECGFRRGPVLEWLDRALEEFQLKPAPGRCERG